MRFICMAMITGLAYIRIIADDVQYFNIFFLCNNEFSINLIFPVNLMPEL